MHEDMKVNSSIVCGDNAKLLVKLEANSVQLTVTSPPYDNLRIYNGYTGTYKEGGGAMTLFACLRCFLQFPAWLFCLTDGRCPACGGRCEEIEPAPEEVLEREY